MEPGTITRLRHRAADLLRGTEPPNVDDDLIAYLLATRVNATATPYGASFYGGGCLEITPEGIESKGGLISSVSFAGLLHIQRGETVVARLSPDYQLDENAISQNGLAVPFSAGYDMGSVRPILNHAFVINPENIRGVSGYGPGSKALDVLVRTAPHRSARLIEDYLDVRPAENQDGQPLRIYHTIRPLKNLETQLLGACFGYER